MRKVANAFGIGKSTVSIIIRRVAKAISVYLAPIYIYKYLAQKKEFKRW